MSRDPKQPKQLYRYFCLKGSFLHRSEDIPRAETICPASARLPRPPWHQHCSGTSVTGVCSAKRVRGLAMLPVDKIHFAPPSKPWYDFPENMVQTSQQTPRDRKLVCRMDCWSHCRPASAPLREHTQKERGPTEQAELLTMLCRISSPPFRSTSARKTQKPFAMLLWCC